MARSKPIADADARPPPLDAKRVARELAQNWKRYAAHTPGVGWRLLQGRNAAWTPDPLGVTLRNQVRAILCKRTDVQISLRTNLVEAELRDELHVDGDEWDDGEWLGLPDGTLLSLDSGAVVGREDARPGVRVSQRLRVAPEEGAPELWLRVLREMVSELSEPDRVIAWLRAWLRYSLSPGCADHSMLFAFGPPGSGKSTPLDAWTWIVGDYGATLDGQRLAGERNEHSQWLAGLAAKRVVRVGELPEHGRWDTVRINGLAGGEVIEANRMRENSFRFASRAKLIISGNHRPRVSPNSGLFRRLRMLECRHVPAALDRKLPEKLRAEGGRILRWVLDGPRELPDVPGDVSGAVERYRSDANPLAGWIAACVEIDPAAFETARALLNSYKQWCNAEGVDPVRDRTFGRLITERFGDGFQKKLDGRNVKCRTGLRLR